MDLNEFRRRLGADPGCRDADLRAARRSGPEFEAAAAAAERFEAQLRDATGLSVPDGLVDELARLRPARQHRRRPLALAASLLLTVGAAIVAWQWRPGWDSVEDYVVDHYRHDGPRLLARFEAGVRPPLDELLAEFRLAVAPEMADIIGVVKVCPTPAGRGLHMVLETPRGPLTVIYMPQTAVDDGATLAFDGLEAMLVDLPSGSAVIVGHRVGDYYAMVHDSLQPLAAGS